MFKLKDQYGTKMWVTIAGAIAAIVFMAGGLVTMVGCASDWGTGANGYGVQNMYTTWQGNSMLYWLLLSNGTRQQVNYNVYNSVKIGSSQVTPDPDEEETDPDDVSDPDDTYSISSSSVSKAASTEDDPDLPSEDEDFGDSDSDSFSGDDDDG